MLFEKMYINKELFRTLYSIYDISAAEAKAADLLNEITAGVSEAELFKHDDRGVGTGNIIIGESLLNNTYGYAERRLANFLEMRKQLIDATPDEYWEAGFESAECEHWIQYYSKKAALEKLGTGQISVATLEQILVLPDEIASSIMLNTLNKEQELITIAQPEQVKLNN